MAPRAPRPWESAPDALVLHARLTPRGGRDAIEGIEHLSDGRPVLKARVRAVPEDGAANRALVALLAEHLSVPRASVSITGGATSRVKTVRIVGHGAALAAVAERLWGQETEAGPSARHERRRVCRAGEL